MEGEGGVHGYTEIYIYWLVVGVLVLSLCCDGVELAMGLVGASVGSE